MARPLDTLAEGQIEIRLAGQANAATEMARDRTRQAQVTSFSSVPLGPRTSSGRSAERLAPAVTRVEHDDGKAPFGHGVVLPSPDGAGQRLQSQFTFASVSKTHLLTCPDGMLPTLAAWM